MKLVGKPLTFVGRFFDGSPTAELIAKAVLAAYVMQFVLTFPPMFNNPASILVALTAPQFDFDFLNGTLGKALVAAWTITMANPFERGASATPPTLSPGPKLNPPDKIDS